MHISRVIIGLVLWLFAPAAFAQTASGSSPPASLADSLTGGAKEDYEAGRRLYESGDYAGAFTAFQSALRESGDPRLLWNAAVCERAMQHNARAIVLVRRYLDSHSPFITPEAARNATLFLEAAEPLTARLDVQSNQPDAVVFVDNEPLGTVPLGPAARLDVGTHQVTVKKRDFADYAVTLRVLDSSDVHLAVVLHAAIHQGRLIVRAGSTDTIAVDGVAVALGTWTSTLPSGPHSVVVTVPGSPPSESQILIADNQTRVIDPNLVDVTTAASKRTGLPAGIPAWAWIVGGGVLAGVLVASVALLQSPDSGRGPIRGSVGFIQLQSP